MLTTEQAVGYLLQQLVALFQWRAGVEKPGALWARQLEQPPAKPQS